MTLKMTITRDVEPSEIVSLVWGAGALTMPWWHGASIRRWEGNRLVSAPEDDVQPTDLLKLTVDDPEEPEGSGKVVSKSMPLQKIADAAGMAVIKGYVYEKDAIQEDLGYCDAIEADCVLQLAMFGKVVYG